MQNITKLNIYTSILRFFAWLSNDFDCFQGIYLAVIGFILYPLNGEPWPTDDHYYIEIVSLLFIWIYGIGIFATIFLCVIAKLVVRRMSAARVVGTLDFETGVRRKSADADSRYPNGDSIRLLNSTDEEI